MKLGNGRVAGTRGEACVRNAHVYVCCIDMKTLYTFALCAIISAHGYMSRPSKG